MQKCVPNCNASFASCELHQAYGHVTLTISARLKYGHRSLVGCNLPRLCSHSWPPCICICGLTAWVVLFSADFLCLRSWHRTHQWYDSLLPCHPLWLTCWFLLPNLSGLPVSMFCCWWIPFLFCAPVVSLHNSGLFLQCTYCYSYGTESCKHTHLSGQLYVYPWDGLEDSLMFCRVSRLCLFRISKDPFGSLWQPSHVWNDYQSTITVFWSRAHRQRHVTICLMKFAVGERNVAIRYIFLRTWIYYHS